MLSTLSIRSRLFLAFFVLLGLLFAVAAVALQRIDALTATTQQLVNFQARRVFIAQSMNQHAQSAAVNLLKLLQTSARDNRVPLYAAMDDEMAASGNAVKELGQTKPEPEIQAEIDHVIDLQKVYTELLQETVELIEIESPEKARTYFEDRTQKVLNTLLFDVQTLQAHLQQMMQAELEQLRASAALAKQLVIWLAAGALVCGSGLAWSFARGIVLPMQEAVSVAQAIADGDYGKSVPNGRGDEIGALLRALRVMRNSISSREEKILRLAYVDPLTDLPNRTRFITLFDARPEKAKGALILIDIDRFAPINNALGHLVGDRLLCQIATRIQHAAGVQCLVARLWGDQFVLMLQDADKATAMATVHKVLAALRAPMTVGTQRLDIDASVGIVLYPQDGADVTTLLRRTDLTMAVAKRRQDHIAFGSEIAGEPPHEQLSLIGEMSEALLKGEFVLYYQPKLNLKENRITAAEALIRWRHPVKGMIPPLHFIPFAEQTGFIREITPWVLRQVIEDAARWHRNGVALVVSANLSTLDLLNHDLVLNIQQLLTQSGLSAAQLCLEITESALLDEPEVALKHLDELSNFGLKLSIDDYGTGQSSLAYVKTLPVNELKIDRAFVTGVDTAPKNAAIVRSTILLCQELGLSVVAEGAESTEELAWLKDNRCDLVQGYGIAKPMPLDEFLEWTHTFNQARQQQEP
jgi:diguanylate cyclase (GGDEF)-like protein